MAKHKYIFDPVSLTYVPVENTLVTKIKKIIPFVLVGASVGLASFGIIANNYKTPQEKMQAQKISEMQTRQAVLEDKITKANSTLNELVVLDDSLYRSLFGMDAVSPVQRLAGTGGVNPHEDMEDSEMPVSLIQGYEHLDNLLAKMNVQKGSYKELFKQLKVNAERMKHVPAIIPVANWDLNYIGSGFSPRRYHPILKRWRAHEGIDFVAPVGKDIHASGDGVVLSARLSDSFGNVVEIDHGFGLVSLYAHMSKIVVKVGQKVTRGDLLGKVGNTGLSAGAHLHYEVHLNGKPVDPVNYFFNDLTPDEYKNVVAQTQLVTECME